MERIAMSQEERDKLEWLKRAKDGVITQREAANKMGVSDRWVRKLLKRMKKRGDASGGAWVAGPGIQPQDRDARRRDRAIELLQAARLARLRADVCQRAVGQTASASK